jgi:DNA polymerase-1
MTETPVRLVLIDGHAIIHRAYHAFPLTLATSKGELTNAVYGFTSILLSTIKDLKPRYLAVAFDKKGPTFRHKKYNEYKATRAAPDKEMVMQIPRIKQVVKALNIPIFEERGFEADDVIGTLVKQVVSVSDTKFDLLSKSHANKQLDEKTTARRDAGSNIKLSNLYPRPYMVETPPDPLAAPQNLKLSNSKNLEIIIVTGDQDAMQLVSDKVKVWMPPRGRFVPAKTYDQQAVMLRYGLKPEQIVDYKALTGDSSDNIPGVGGIGPKTAQGLLGKYRTLTNVYQHLDDLPESVRLKLKEGRESAFLSQDLAQIRYDAPVVLDLSNCRLSDYHKEEAVRLFEELEFRSLIKRLPEDSWEEMVKDTMTVGGVDKDIKRSKKPSKPEGQLGLF